MARPIPHPTSTTARADVVEASIVATLDYRIEQAAGIAAGLSDRIGVLIGRLEPVLVPGNDSPLAEERIRDEDRQAPMARRVEDIADTLYALAERVTRATDRLGI